MSDPCGIGGDVTQPLRKICEKISKNLRTVTICGGMKNALSNIGCIREGLVELIEELENREYTPEEIIYGLKEILKDA